MTSAPSTPTWRRLLLALTATAVGLAAAVVPLAAPAAAEAVSNPAPLPPAAGHDVPPFATPVPGRAGSTATADGPAAPTVPPTPTGLPVAAELLSPYIPQRSCDYSAKPGVSAFQTTVQSTYPDTGSYGIVNTCLREVTTSEHAEGRAWDWAVSINNPQQVAEVNALFGWLFAPDANGNTAAMARRLGIMYMIWNGRIWGSYAATQGWRPYTCSGATACHQDHVHFSFSWAGAWKRTSYWTRNVAPVDYGPCAPAGQRYAPAYAGFTSTPCPAYVAPPAPTSDLQLIEQDQNLVAILSDAGTAVAVIQRQVHTTADGQYGAGTAAAVSAYQRAHGLPATGSVGPATWRAFLGGRPPPAPTVSWAGVPAPAEVAAGSGASLFIRTAPGGLARKDYRDGHWGAWTALTGSLTGAPSATLGRSGAVVAVRGTDNRVYAGTVAGSPWLPLGGIASSAPGVAAGPYGTEVFVRGADGGIWTRTSAATARWLPLGGRCLSAPAVAVGPDGSAVVLVVGTNRMLYQNRRTAGRWTGWTPVGGVVTADPALTLVPATSQLVTVVRGGNGQAYAAQGSLSSTAWSGWQPLGGYLISGAAAVSTGAGRSQLTAYGLSGRLYQRSGGPAWGGWTVVP